MLKPSCSGCGSSQDLYGSNCKHMTLCVSCGKTMAKNQGKCFQCGAIVTRLIREYNVRASLSTDKNYFIGRFMTGFPNFSRKKNAENRWSLQKDGLQGQQVLMLCGLNWQHIRLDASLPVFPSSWFCGPSTVTQVVSREDIFVSGPITSGSGYNNHTVATTSDNMRDSNTMSQNSLLGAEYEVASTVLHPGRNHNPESSVSDDLPIISMNNGMLQNFEPASHTDLPKTVARILNESSSPMSMDFHPVQQTFLLVGTDIGDIGLWDVNLGVKMLSKNFTVWNIGACSTMFKRFPVESKGRRKKLQEMCFNAFGKAANLDVLNHPVLNLIYYLLVEILPSSLVLFILRKLPPKRGNVLLRFFLAGL
ncbi:hypothetical protein J1N35_041269 [Gossypium stocksii]|uniref:Transcription initiation factor IIF subunit alpha n=1 Tax=Gossypium stocksii TaxID=47602 RepID=A0A9D3UFE8_9ROSI|nr:hypothetical protein J1N35_041269 [Gossypium stocksii]